MTPAQRGYTALGVGLGADGVWALAATRMFSGHDLKGAIWGGIVLLTVVSLIACFLVRADMTGYEWGESPSQYRNPPMSSWMREQQAHDEYLRRRAEDSRMRSLMNPNSQQSPPTDWFGR